MPTATENHTPKPPAPSRRALFSGGAAILAGTALAATVNAAPAATAIGALHRQLRVLSVRHHETDVAIVNTRGPEFDALSVALDAILTDCLALQRRITKLPAQTLEDVAIQATVGFYLSDQCDDDDVAPDLRRIQASIVLATVKAAGLDIDSLGWGDMRRLCAFRAPRGEALA